MLTEAAVVAMVSRLVGYDPARAAGVFTFGGTGTVLYGAKLGIEKAFPDAMDNGVPGGGMILASAQSHYCRLNVAAQRESAFTHAIGAGRCEARGWARSVLQSAHLGR